MDTFGQIFIVVAILVIVAGGIGFWTLSRYAPKGIALGVAAVLYVLSFLIGDGGSREMHGALGMLRMLGFMGGILGLIDLVRGPRDRTPRS